MGDNGELQLWFLHPEKVKKVMREKEREKKEGENKVEKQPGPQD